MASSTSSLPFPRGNFRFALLSWATALTIAGVLAGCAPEKEKARVFTVQGVVREPYSEGTITIQHEEIPGFMPAMTMPFYASEADARPFVPGDRVEFEFRVGQSSLATKFRRLGREEPTLKMSSQRPAASSLRRLRAGDQVPAFSLIDQDDQPLSEAGFRGRNTVLTFIFTRCPVPEFCPLISGKFESLQQALARETSPPGSSTQLLSISIDPEHDRPAVLRSYAQSLGADPARWRFATGPRDAIEELTRLFAVHTENAAGMLNHTLATALIGPDGKVVEIWRGNAWKPEEVLAKIRGGK